MSERSEWYSSKVRIVVLIETIGASRYHDSVFVFKASDFDDAFNIALKLGKSLEECFRNEADQMVKWQLKEVVSLDILPRLQEAGTEVYAEPIDMAEGEKIDFDAEFQPEKSQPTQTGVFQDTNK